MVIFIIKLQNLEKCVPFCPTRGKSRMHTFEKRQGDGCQHRSVVKFEPL